MYEPTITLPIDLDRVHKLRPEDQALVVSGYSTIYIVDEIGLDEPQVTIILARAGSVELKALAR